MTDSKTNALRQEVLSKIAVFVREAVRDSDQSSITEDTTFLDLHTDSLDMVELSMELEDTFGVDLKTLHVSWLTVKEAIDSVVALKAEQNV